MKVRSFRLLAAALMGLGSLSTCWSADAPSAAQHTYVAPIPIKQFDPQFPFELYVQGVSGTATVDIVVDTNGNVSSITGVEASQVDFGGSAASCIRKWKFKPAFKDGVPIAVKLRVPFTFTNHYKKRS